jgi:hypothetical protein
MDDDELCKLKNEWIKLNFTIDLNPSAKQLSEAEQATGETNGLGVSEAQERLFASLAGDVIAILRSCRPSHWRVPACCDSQFFSCPGRSVTR